MILLPHDENDVDHSIYECSPNQCKNIYIGFLEKSGNCADLKGKYNTYSGCFSREVKEGMTVRVFLVDSMPLFQKHLYLDFLYIDFQNKNY